ncbi:hypothetical protein BKA81DRAFT_64819 [Phyllosticta paracitricarpa]
MTRAQRGHRFAVQGQMAQHTSSFHIDHESHSKTLPATSSASTWCERLRRTSASEGPLAPDPVPGQESLNYRPTQPFLSSRFWVALAVDSIADRTLSFQTAASRSHRQHSRHTDEDRGRKWQSEDAGVYKASTASHALSGRVGPFRQYATSDSG